MGDILHTIVVHHGKKICHVDNVDPDRYSYLDFVTDLFELLHRGDSGGPALEIYIRCKSPRSIGTFELKTDADLMKWFGECKDVVEMHAYVTISHVSGVGFQLQGTMSASARADGGAEAHATCIRSGSGTLQASGSVSLAPCKQVVVLDEDKEDDGDEDMNVVVEGEGVLRFSSSDNDMWRPDEGSNASHLNEDKAAFKEQVEGSSDELSDFYEDEVEEATASDEEEHVHPSRDCSYTRYMPDSDGRVHFARGMLFVDVKDFREKLGDYCIQEGFKIKRKKNERTRVTVECAAEGCPWRIHATPTVRNDAYMVKTYRNMHTCVRTKKNVKVNSKWISKKLEPLFKSNPKIKLSGIQDYVKQNLGIEVSRGQLYRARKQAKDKAEGSNSEFDTELPAYAKLLLESNSGSIVKSQFHQVRCTAGPSTVWKRSTTVRCGICKHFGHNKRGCQRASMKQKGKKNPRQAGVQSEALQSRGATHGSKVEVRRSLRIERASRRTSQRLF